MTCGGVCHVGYPGQESQMTAVKLDGKVALDVLA